MLSIHSNHILLRKKHSDIIQSINDLIARRFANLALIHHEIRIYFLEEEEYYARLGYHKPYQNLVITDGYFDKKYHEIFIRANCKSIIRTYIHELGHYFDYNIKTEDLDGNIGSAFTRKIVGDIPFEDQVLKDLKMMPATTLINLAADSQYIFAGDEIFARLFEVYIWERLGRRHFTPDLYIHTPKFFLRLNNWLANNKNSVWFRMAQRVHFYLLNRYINARKAHDPFKQDKFSHYVEDLLQFTPPSPQQGA